MGNRVNISKLLTIKKSKIMFNRKKVQFLEGINKLHVGIINALMKKSLKDDKTIISLQDTVLKLKSEVRSLEERCSKISFNLGGRLFNEEQKTAELKQQLEELRSTDRSVNEKEIAKLVPYNQDKFKVGQTVK